MSTGSVLKLKSKRHKTRQALPIQPSSWMTLSRLQFPSLAVYGVGLGCAGAYPLPFSSFVTRPCLLFHIHTPGCVSSPGQETSIPSKDFVKNLVEISQGNDISSKTVRPHGCHFVREQGPLGEEGSKSETHSPRCSNQNEPKIQALKSSYPGKQEMQEGQESCKIEPRIDIIHIIHILLYSIYIYRYRGVFVCLCLYMENPCKKGKIS